MRAIPLGARILFLLLLTVSALPAEPPAGAAGAIAEPLAKKPEVAEKIQVLDSWIRTTMANREQPGLSIGIIYDQELVWAKGYGFADAAKKAPATPATLYRIASISKLFTSTAIMQLRDQGKLQLDDPVERRLPWFKIRYAEPGGPVITIRHLITHTSGLPREAKALNWSDRSFPKREEMIRLLPEQETLFPAESHWKYSNLALSLAGEVVAQVSGEPWSSYIEKHILQPLGMSATRTLPRADMPGLAVGYSRRMPGTPREIEPFVDIEAERPAGNMSSNVEDLAKFLSLQFRDGAAGGAQVLRGSTIREMHRVQWLRPDWRSGWGLGFSIRRVGEQVRVGHGGDLPGHRTQVEVAPEEKVGVIVLTNAADGDPVRYLDQAFAIVGPALARAGAPPKHKIAPDPAWEKYVGTYTWRGSGVEVLVLDGELTMVFPEADNPWEARIRLQPVSGNRFRMLGATTYGEPLTFETGPDGRVTRMSTPHNYWLRK